MERRDQGTVTVELALALPAVIGLMAVCLAVGSAAVAQVGVLGAARAAARAAALGLSDAEVEAAAVAVAGGGVTVSVSRGGGLVQVTCGRRVALAPFGSGVASAAATAVCEPARGCG
ncbi:MAG: hypothetical protein LBD77_10775 [Bifidobacteriaceae bacterium]|jgi:Flp pilus assembly protein TadG|nr:hypothetical protein [Bifidobacteriaceae bacterium]